MFPQVDGSNIFFKIFSVIVAPIKAQVYGYLIPPSNTHSEHDMNLLLSPDFRVRENQALGHIARERRNISVYKKLLDQAPPREMKKVLRTRILASNNHINGWLDWIKAGCPIDPRANTRLDTYPEAREDMFV